MSESLLSDAGTRAAAETTFDRNIVVEAGAGTGKTTLLVNRFLHLLLREPGSIPITKIVALTFSNKAATEMKVRLRNRLHALVSSAGPDTRAGEVSSSESEAVQNETARQMDELRTRYRLSHDELVGRAEAALRDFDKAQIGTLHSFAGHLLRLYPIESMIPPLFQEDDGLRFDEHLTTCWQVWIDRELGVEGTQHEQWKFVLNRLRLDQVQELARELCSELVSLDDLIEQVRSPQLPDPVRQWLTDSARIAEALLAERAESRMLKIDEMLQASASLFRLLLTQGTDGLRHLGESDRAQLDRIPGGRPRGMDEETFETASTVIRAAKACLTVETELGRTMVDLLVPFVREVRRSFVESGWMSFDGLTARACALLRDHSSVRERLKRDYRALLIDEFQDTDPVQYELVLFLAEELGQQARAWQDIELESGKVFIVGDPKQSIYAFRRADIEAFDRVVEKLESGGGERRHLTMNFRSHGSVLSVVNELFDRAFVPQRHLQPTPVRLNVKPNRSPLVGQPGVELYLVTGHEAEDEFDSAAATRAEAESLVQWIAGDLLPREHYIDERGTRSPLKPGHIAILFRKLTQAQDYLDALRRHGIAYVTDGEKHFYRRQEVIDLVNVLRVIENPNDAIAMVGLLRSPIGGLADRDLHHLSSRRALDFRLADRLDSWESSHVETIRRLYHELWLLHRELPRLPLSEAVAQVFARLPLLELAAASLHGEQAVANLLKVQEMAVSLSDRPALTLNGFVEEMIKRLEEQPQESESTLAEDSIDSIHVLTIHKAKGLEFPVVILPGLHQGTRSQGRSRLIGHDWSSDLYGLWLADGRAQTLGSVLVHSKQQAREEAEQRRVLYVGMTRAKDRLILSGGVTRRPRQDTTLSLLREIVQEGLGDPAVSRLTIGNAMIAQTVAPAQASNYRPRVAWADELKPSDQDASIIEAWIGRTKRWREAQETARALTPSILIQSLPARGLGRRREATEERSRRISQVIGVLAHRLLEHWDYGARVTEFSRLIETLCRSRLPPDCEPERLRIQTDLIKLFDAFGRSEAYRLLQRAELLGREVPFSIPWQQGPGRVGQVMTGTIDAIYRVDGQVWVAEYKTDTVSEDAMPDLIRRYAWQVQAYQTAVRQTLAVDQVGFQFIFLRQGLMIPG